MQRDLRAGKTARPCPCGSGRPYRDCCAPYHFGDREAPDAVTLMRSRYAAFAVGDASYLWRTLHPMHEDKGRDREEVVAELRASMQELRFMGLRILDSREHGDTAAVLFLVRVFERSRDRSFVELSDFLREPGGWRYLGGVARACSDLEMTGDLLKIDAFSAFVRDRARR